MGHYIRDVKVYFIRYPHIYDQLKKLLADGWSFTLACKKVQISRYLQRKLLEQSPEFQFLYNEYYSNKKGQVIDLTSLGLRN